jgi:hypothetical protein
MSAACAVISATREREATVAPWWREVRTSDGEASTSIFRMTGETPDRYSDCIDTVMEKSSWSTHSKRA